MAVDRVNQQRRLAAAANGTFFEPFPKVTPHDMRHTAASLSILAGGNVKTIQRSLGHASAAMTLDVYAGLLDNDLNDVANALNILNTLAEKHRFGGAKAN